MFERERKRVQADNSLFHETSHRLNNAQVQQLYMRILDKLDKTDIETEKMERKREWKETG